MKLKKILAALMAAVMCLSLGMTAFADVEQSTAEASTEESSSVEASTNEETSAEATTKEEESSKKEESSSEEATTKEPTKEDVIALIVKLLGQIDLVEVKDSLNDINEALGLPRIETFTDIPAYADALYEKLEELGLGYGDIINGIGSSDLLDWLGNLIFGGGSSDKTTAPAVTDDNSSDNNIESTPDTGIALGASIAAAAVLGLGGTTAFVLAKRKNEE